MTDVVVAVAAHKPAWMPSDPLYLPVQAGACAAEPIEGYQSDAEGDEISFLNARLSELTVLYWLWRNGEADYKGLVHYRRYFAGSGEKGIMTKQEALTRLAQAPVILPKRRHYVIETIESHYTHTMDPTHLDLVRDVLSTREPAYLATFEANMRKRSAHLFNMMVMRSDLLDAYCSWLFPVLLDVDERIDYANMSAFHARAVGRLAERLMDTWIDANGISYTECAVANIEGVDWVKKGSSFLRAKAGLARYEQSF